MITAGFYAGDQRHFPVAGAISSPAAAHAQAGTRVPRLGCARHHSFQPERHDAQNSRS